MSALTMALLACAASPAQTDVLYAWGEQVEIAIGTGAVAGDADHARCALSPRGDIVVVWRVNGAPGEAQEVHGCYFRLVRKLGVSWVPGPSFVLAGEDADARSCSVPDVVYTYDHADPDNGAFVVVWGRLRRGQVMGGLEAATVRAPAVAGQLPVVEHSDGITGAVLDASVDTWGGGVRPDLAWHPRLGMGRFGVSYNHRVADSGSSVTLDLRWVEAELPAGPGTALVHHSATAVAGVELYGTLYARPGGYLPSCVEFMPYPGSAQELRLMLAYGESIEEQGVDGAQIVLQSLRFAAGQEPVSQFRTTIRPDLLSQDRVFHRPRLAWNGVTDNASTIQLAFYAIEDLGLPHRRSFAYTVHTDTGLLEEAAWTPRIGQQAQPAPIALDGRQALVYDNTLRLWVASGDAAALTDYGSRPLGRGTLPDAAWVEGRGPAGEDVVVISSHRPSDTLPGGEKRVHVQMLVADL